MSESAVIRLNPVEASFMDGVYREYAVNLYKYLRVYIKRMSDDDIYDCVQDTFVIAMKKIKEFVCVSNVGGWIYRTAIFNARNFVRKRKYELSRIVYRELEEKDIVDSISTEQIAIENVESSSEEFYDKMHDFFMTLNEEERTLYNCLVQKMDYKNIALKLDVNLNRVYYLSKKFERRMRSYILR